MFVVDRGGVEIRSDALAGKVALITGASSGIGEAAALALDQAGCCGGHRRRRADRLEDLGDAVFYRVSCAWCGFEAIPASVCAQ